MVSKIRCHTGSRTTELNTETRRMSDCSPSHPVAQSYRIGCGQHLLSLPPEALWPGWGPDDLPGGCS